MKLRGAVERATAAARNAGCDVDDLVGYSVGRPKEPHESVMRTDRCRDVRLVLGRTVGTVIDDAKPRGHMLRAVRAVQSRAPHRMFFVAAEVVDLSARPMSRGPIGLWASDAIDSPNVVVAVDAIAPSYSELSDAEIAGIEIAETDDGAEEALECSRRVEVA